jgi:hypothetical protein
VWVNGLPHLSLWAGFMVLQPFKIPYVYDCVTKICRKQAEVIKNHDSENVRNIGKREAQHRKQGSNLAAVRLTIVQVSKLLHSAQTDRCGVYIENLQICLYTYLYTYLKDKMK